MNNNLFNKLIKFNQIDINKDINIKMLHLKIEYYELRLKELYKTKPYKFQKNKLNNYYKKIEEYTIILNKLYNELSIELEKNNI